MAYLIKRNNDRKELFSSDVDFSGYKFKPKKSNVHMNVSKVVVVNPKMIDNILCAKFNKMFKNLMAISLSVINDDDADDSDCALALDEVALVRSILLNRYQKFLSQKKEELFLKRLRVIENQLRLKQIMIKKQEMMFEYEESVLNTKGGR